MSAAQTFTIEGLFPADTPGFMFPAWLNCLEWAIGETQIVAAFRKDTGNNWSPATSPLDKMIDEACGVGEDFLRQFIEWFNVNVWGPIDGPADDDIVQRIDAA